MVDLCEMLDIFNRLFKASNSVNKNAQERIEWNLTVYVGFAMHVTALVILLLVAQLGGLPLSKHLSEHAVADLNLNFPNYTVLTLAVTCPVEEDHSLEHRGICLFDILIFAVFIVRNQITQILNRHLCIANHELLVILVEHY